MPDVVTHHRVTRLVSLERALIELQPFVQDARYLRNGRGISNFGRMLPREFLANWLVCAAANGSSIGPYTFTTDPTGGDGVILDEESGRTFCTEHVAVLLPPDAPDQNGNAEGLLLRRIGEKNAEGAQYASGKTLVVFNEVPAGPWQPNRVARALPAEFHFDAVWVVGLQRVEDDGTYVYGVCLLDVFHYFDAPTYLVRISPSFDSWRVEQQQ